jgi:hypothetical protein
MEVENVLPSAPFHIENKAVPRAVDTVALCNLPGSVNQCGDQGMILLAHVIDAADVFSWNNQNVDRCLRSDVIEGNDSLPLVDKVGFLLSPDDSAEYAIFERVHFQQTIMDLKSYLISRLHSHTLPPGEGGGTRMGKVNGSKVNRGGNPRPWECGPFTEPLKKRGKSTDHFRKDLSCVADHDRATGSKEIIFDRLFPALRGTQVDSEQLPAHDGAMHGFEAAHELFDKVVDLETGFLFACGVLSRETKDQKSPGDRSAFPSHAHARAEGASQFEGGLPFQAVVLAETGKDGLCSCVTLVKKRNRFFGCVH